MQHSMRVLAVKDSAFLKQAEDSPTLTWDEIGERHPHIYGDPDVHGKAADGADGDGIGQAAAHLAFDRPGNSFWESEADEGPWDLDFRLEHVPVNQIDYARHDPGDSRVRSARRWYRESPDEVVPPVLVHRHGVYQVADGHHRGEGAAQEGLETVPAYVAHSPYEEEPFSDGTRGPFHGAEVVHKHASAPEEPESDEAFWRRMEREYPGQQNTNPLLISPDQAGLSYDDEDPALDSAADDDWDEILPHNTSLAEHAHVLRSGFRWDGDERNPEYHAETWRDILDSDGRRAGDKEGHVIERNTNVMRPQLDEDADPLSYPWMHTYYPAGQSDDEGLVAGYNTAHQATRAAHQLALYGARFPKSQEVLKKYRYLGSEEPYDPSEELPHEKAMRAGPRA